MNPRIRSSALIVFLTTCLAGPLLAQPESTPALGYTNPANPATEGAWKLLDWPFLLFVIIVGFVALFHKQIANILGHEFSIKLKELEVRFNALKKEVKEEVGDEMQQELDPLRDDLDTAPRETRKIKTATTGSHLGGSQVETGAPGAPDTIGATTSPAAQGAYGDQRDDEAIRRRMKTALEDERYRWQAISRLGDLAGIDEEHATSILRADPDVVLGKGKSGRILSLCTPRRITSMRLCQL